MNKITLSIAVSLFLCLVACKSRNHSFCTKNDRILSDTVFFNKDILLSEFFNDSCQLKKVDILTCLDKRSGTILNINDIDAVIIRFGVFGDTIIRKSIEKDFSLLSNNEKNVLSVSIGFSKPFLDEINFIDLSTRTKTNNNGTFILNNSLSYFYKNSLELLKMSDTYMDYRAFKDKELAFKKIENVTDTYLFTVKTRKKVDEITKVHLQLNDSILLNFRNSVIASFKDHKVEDKSYKILDFIKRPNNMLEFKIKSSTSNFVVDRAEVSLN